MRLAASLFVLGIAWLVVTVWDAGTLGWTPAALLYFIDTPQFLYVMLPALAVTVIVHSWSTLLSGVAMALGMRPHAEKEDVVQGGRALHFMGHVALWSGAGISLIEAVISAHNAVSLAGFLPALGVSALAVFYGLLIRVGCGLAVQILKMRLGSFVFYSE
jgi:hypothetical protein